ncbi:probable cytochrome P450 304a1 isoform X1 [Thrips palmi]|uniref:Probable cytochrome P450 304a1 isoform X1 n=2 Tax=Thrips palmi TaxID=161013 RepID=A0A6P8ZKB6_THRPL|nr:probable cytochrome P450 304a1 isoform X1 [Thrips palmi]XP_034236819.1 probable cytochrome P450 304a1 isoform X1 [Thrips palmi]XP_034236821.1 probable cytochrome P450 304a1 isoform X1 [Thrips palmi]
MQPLLVVLFLCGLIACLIKFVRDRPPMFPPGPPRLPVYGGYLHLLAYNYRYTHKGLVAMAAKYKSPVLGMYFGSSPTIITTDFASTRELLLKPEFQGRPDIFTARLRSFNELWGIFFTEGPLWAEQRRFSLRHMRDFGFGRRFAKMEAATEEEVRTLLDSIRSPVAAEKGMVRDGEVLLPDLLYPGFINAMLETLTGERVPRDRHDKLRGLSRAVRLFQRHVEPSGGAVNITPWARHLLPDTMRVTGFQRGNQGVLDFVDELLEKEKGSFDENALRGFVDVFLAEMHKRPDSHFTDKQLVMVLVDYLFPVSTVPPVTVAMALSYLAQHPDKQDAAHREIVAVVGRGRLPTLDDRPSLPYTEAILREVLRLDTNTVLSVTHKCTEDTFFREYFVPKGTLLIPNIWAANRDPAVFEKGDEFVPERFLDSRTGTLKKKDPTMAFGLGKRLCAGETFSRQTMFLYLSALLQNYSFAVSADGYLPSEEDMIPGVLVTPKSFWLRVAERP